tara:strand:- start:188 stop:376 length:189 start_codon:yes stop_codon:yes gene_type:complete
MHKEVRDDWDDLIYSFDFPDEEKSNLYEVNTKFHDSGKVCSISKPVWVFSLRSGTMSIMAAY